MDPKKEIAKLIYKTAKEAFRRGYRAWKKSKKEHESYKGKSRHGRTISSEGVVPYEKEHIKKAIRSVKFQGRAAKLAKKQKKPPGAKARGISFVGKGYQGDKTKSMQVPMASKVQMRKIREEIGASVKKFMKEKVGRKAKGGVIDPEGYDITKREMGILANADPSKREMIRKFLSRTKNHKFVYPDRILENKRGRRMGKAKGGLSQGRRGKGPRKSEEEYYFDFREKMDKKKKQDQWRKDMEKDLEYYEKDKKGVWVSKGGLLRKPKLAKRGF